MLTNIILLNSVRQRKNCVENKYKVLRGTLSLGVESDRKIGTGKLQNDELRQL
jgi:hypothetical protein